MPSPPQLSPSAFTVLEANSRADPHLKALISMISKGTGSSQLPVGLLVLPEHFWDKAENRRRGVSHLNPNSTTAPHTDVYNCRNNTSWPLCNLYRAGTEVKG